jgi:hypothetical protein
MEGTMEVLRNRTICYAFNDLPLVGKWHSLCTTLGYGIRFAMATAMPRHLARYMLSLTWHGLC